MEEKTYQQMRQEFIEFYHNDVKSKLPQYNKMRRSEMPKQICFWGAFTSIILIFTVPIFALFLFPLPFILIGLLIFLTRNDTHYGNTTYIKSDYETELKKPLMKKFVDIFLNNGTWRKTYGIKTETGQIYTREALKERSSVIRSIRMQKLLNPFPYIGFDDIITGQHEGINICIFEANTNIFNRVTIFLIPFFSIFLTIMSCGIFLIIALLLSIIFMWKILQYKAFRGVVVQFDMNKEFKGHTFFHENSFNAKKIPFNKQKYNKVDLESITFENKYNVYSTDQIEARYLLTPSMMERIENLKFTFKAKYVRGSFKANKLTLAIHTGKDMLAMGSDYKDSDANTFQELYDEMISILKIVDELKLNEHIGL